MSKLKVVLIVSKTLINYFQVTAAISRGIKKSEQVLVGIDTDPSIGTGLQSLSTIHHPHSRLRQSIKNK
jgi:hypothetical protein